MSRQPAQSELAPLASDDDRGIEAITKVMLAIARGEFDARVPRSHDGSALDVLAFLVNATAEETAHLVQELEHERRELERAQERLVQTAKLVALGELAGGMAHELNQPLTVLEALLQLMRRRPDQRVGDCETQLDLMQQATRRMAGVVDQVRTFARQTPFVRAALDPLQPLDEALQLLGRPLACDGIEIARRIDAELPLIHGDADRLEQVLVSLLCNAHAAVLERDGDAPALIHVEVRRDERAVRYAVEDSGPGVPADLRARIFDPFFTTRPVGKAAGLGLSVSRSIVEQHGGRLRYECSERGARFVFDIPLAAEDAAGG